MQEERQITSSELAQKVHSLSRSIQQAALLADWIEAARLVEDRAPLLTRLTGDQGDETLRIARCIQVIDESVLAMAASSKEELEAEYCAAMKRTSVTKHYHSIALL
ncbi:flagellar protein FliT [Paraburkholderia sp. RCC_158]|uniref:flagellar protein FliT n=1 Tax=Paraburkholderia sp. RCC_158 TaxID=3239220 RepID=UPI0035269D90